MYLLIRKACSWGMRNARREPEIGLANEGLLEGCCAPRCARLAPLGLDDYSRAVVGADSHAGAERALGCVDHGEVGATLRIRKSEDDLFFADKTIWNATEEDVQEIRARREAMKAKK